MDLSAFPRTPLCTLPTPLQPLENLSRVLGGPRLLIKRDDMTGLALGGNKGRQLEFYMGEALARGADTIITTGAVQSNHVCQTAAAAAKLGLACHVQLETRVVGKGPEYARTGNALLDRVFGAIVHFFPEGEDEAAADAAVDRIADDVREKGGRPFVIHLGSDHQPLGALGYVEAAAELAEQTAAAGIAVDAVVVPSGSASTHAGLLVGLKAIDHPARVLGMCIRRDQEAQAARVRARVAAVAEMIGRPGLVSDTDVWTDDACLGPGYGQPTPEMVEAVELMARHEGIVLDPVYTGKALAGLIGLLRQGFFQTDETVLFIHTGGIPALFAYPDLFVDS